MLKKVNSCIKQTLTNMFLKIFTVSTSHWNGEDPSGGSRTVRIKGLNKYIQHLKVEESNLAASKRCVHPLSGAHS